MKRKLLLFLTMLCVSIGTWADQVSFGSKGSWYEINGTTVTIHVAEDHDLGRDNSSVYSTLAAVSPALTKIVFDSESQLSGTDVRGDFINQLSSVETVDFSGATFTGGNTNYYLGNYSKVKKLILNGVTSDKEIQIANNNVLQAVFITTTTATDVTFTNNSALTGIIKNEKVNTSATFTWTGTYKTFHAIDQVNYTKDAEDVDKTALIVEGSMGADDVANLDVLNDVSGELRLLDLSGVTLTSDDNTFPFSGNRNLYSVVLPKGLSDVDKTWFTGCSNLYAAVTYNDGVTDLKAYISTPGTLKNVFMDLWRSGAVEAGGGTYQNNSCELVNYAGITDGASYSNLQNTVTSVKISGTFNSNDIGGNCGNYSSDGHVAFDKDDIEYDNAAGVATGGRAADGAMRQVDYSSHIATLDLSDAIPQIPTDLRLAAFATNYKNLKVVKLPTDETVTEIPRDCFNGSDLAGITSLCIPYNFQVIGARAFNALKSLYHVYTTDPDSEIKVDNGAVTAVSEGVETFVYGEEAATAEKLYGTITLPANLKKIESFAFAGQTRIKDLYVLAEEAPECHVDAFSTSMYVGNNTYDKGSITDGVISRDAYTQGNYNFITLLHYPRTAKTPNIQRYTDPTREYSVATGERDGNGNTLYYPNQSEFVYAYLQGSYGYLWKAWDDSRNWYDNELTSGYGDNATLDQSSHLVNIGTRGQNSANNLWENNTYANKNDRSFYDVTMGDGNVANEATAPSGLKPYYNTIWEEAQLYPQAEMSTVAYFKYVAANEEDFANGITLYTKSGDDYSEYTGATVPEGTYYKRVQQQKVDEDGNLAYNSCSAGHFVKDFKYVPAADGAYVEVATADGYTAVTSPVDGVSTYYSDESGTEVTPKVGSGFWYQDGMKNVFTELSNEDKAGDIRDRDQYYYADGTLQDVYFNSNHNPLWYPSGETEVVNKCTQLVGAYSNAENLWNTAETNNVTDIYVQRDGKYVLGMPTLNGNKLIKDGDSYIEVSVLQPKGTTYYGQSGDYYYEVQLNNVQISEAAYYSTGTEEQPVYLSSDKYIAGKDWYEKNGDNYTAVTKMDWWNYARDINSTTFYYLSGSDKNIVTAENTDYDSSVTYYTDNAGTSEATTVNFNTTYYVQAYTYAYEEYNGQEGTRVAKVEYIRAATNEEIADASIAKYCPDMVDVEYHDIKDSHDYRGWHQFVLTAYAYNGTTPMEPLKSFITDNDWWTICEPYDLRYKDMIKFFGTEDGNKIPYLSKLMYVVRDVENQRITLMFSKNLMEYKEQFNSNEGSNVETRVHGTIDDKTKWTDAELAENPVILHAGVPYLIRPNLTFTDGKAVRQFDNYKKDNEELYTRLNNAQNQSGEQQKNLVYNGIYTVPAFVVGYESADAVSEGTLDNGELSIAMKDGTTFTYKDSQHGGEKLQYGGKAVDFKISSEYKYSFVGSFYKSVMPQYSYFLGWDSKNNRATFWYSEIQDETGWNWNNETGIICPNFDIEKEEIHKASGLNDPARWTITNASGVSSLSSDDFKTTSAGGAKAYGMENGGVSMVGDNEATGIEEIATSENIVGESISVYNVNGVFMGNSVEGLAKGLYIVNGKKYVVK